MCGKLKESKKKISDKYLSKGKYFLQRQQHSLLDQYDFASMERGHRVCKLAVFKKFDISYLRIWLNTQTQQIVLSKWNCVNNSSCSSLDTPGSSTIKFEEEEGGGGGGINKSFSFTNNTTTNSFSSRSSSSNSYSFSLLKTQTLDLRLIKDVQILGQIGTTMQIAEKWRRDYALQRFDTNTVLCISWGNSFIPNNWLILFDNQELCNLWCQGIKQLCIEQESASHALIVERWLRKQFYSLLVHPTDNACISIKHMKPFVQQKLQCKISGKQLQEIIENEMGFENFVFAHNWLLDFHSLFMSMFSEFVHPQNEHQIPFRRFVDFLRELQNDELGKSPELASNYLRRYFRDVDPERDIAEPWLSTTEFIDYLFSSENSLFDPINKEVVHDMSKPLTHYWISSSHNTYLTGDQLKSESSLDAYARSLLLGCRCIELDCWDGPQRKGLNGEIIIDIIIYHGYTMTSKLLLKDVLQTIKYYAFKTSEYPLILSIEDNCSVQAQRQMAIDIQEILGELLLTSPISRDEWELPSPLALRNKIILKHKKLREQQENDNLNLLEDELDQDILSRQCIKKGILWLKNNNNNNEKIIWKRHIFVLFHDRLCYLIQPVDDEKLEGNELIQKQEINEYSSTKLKSVKEINLNNQNSEEELLNEGNELNNRNSICSSSVEDCTNCHITEEWFHGKIDRDEAKQRLLNENNNNNSLLTIFLVRESNTFIGDFTLSFLFNGNVHHCRIKSIILSGGEKRYYLLDTLKKESLYELISYYMKHSLNTPTFKTCLFIPCPQPQPHLDQPWFCLNCDTQKAEELLTKVGKDGAFLIRYSKNDIQNSFVLSLRIDSINCHLRLKREGRVFVIGNQIFENLCELVNYFEINQFFRGICLKYPVNEETINKYLNNNNYLLKEEEEKENDLINNGCYVELNDLNNEIQVEAIESFNNNEYFIENLMKNEQFNKLPNKGKALYFPIGAKITILQKQKLENEKEKEKLEKYILLGRYNNEIGWFPSCYVREIINYSNSNNICSNELNYGTIELAGTSFEENKEDNNQRKYSFRICLSQSHWKVQVYIVAADNEEELRDWLLICQKQSKQANDKIQQLRNKERQLKIASQLSCLVVYCQAVPFNPDFKLQDPRNSFFEMCSFSESKHDKLLEKGLTLFNQRQLSRVYPQASRLTSTNFNPLPMWNSGCHMVALNFQTGDKSMQLNYGRFSANGRCGYVLKPQYLMDETFWQRQQLFQQYFSLEFNNNSNKNYLNGNGGKKKLICLFCRNNRNKLILNNKEQEIINEKNKDEILQKCYCKKLSLDLEEISEEKQQENNNENNNNEVINNFILNKPIILIISIIAGRHLSRKCGNDKGGICSPYVEIELLGFGNDSQIQRTNTISSNGLNPVWQERFNFKIQYPEMCLLRFFVEDGDFVGPKTDPFIGQAVFSLDCIRPGFRSVPLLNQFSEPLELSSLLVHIEIREWKYLNNITTNIITTKGGRSNSLLLIGNSCNLLKDSKKISSNELNLNSLKDNNLIENKPIWNIHNLLQFGRSILAGGHQDELIFDNRNRIIENNLNMSSEFNGDNSTQQTNQLIEQNNNLNYTFRTLPTTSVRNSTLRTTGTSTLRKLFRLGRNSNN